MNVSIRPRGQPINFRYGDEQLVFERVKRPQATGRILIKVHPDCRIVVSAPEDASNEAVLCAVKKRGRWIYQQLREFRQQLEHITPRRFVSGETHFYLGKQYLLKVIEAPDQVQGVKLLRGKLEVSLRKRNADKVRDLLSDWYRVRAKENFTRRLTQWSHHSEPASGQGTAGVY